MERSSFADPRARVSVPTESTCHRYGKQMVDETIRAQIVEALANWDRDGFTIRSSEADQLRHDFVDTFPVESWSTMPLERYALGTDVEGGSACWWLDSRPGSSPASAGVPRTST